MGSGASPRPRSGSRQRDTRRLWSKVGMLIGRSISGSVLRSPSMYLGGVPLEHILVPGVVRGPARMAVVSSSHAGDGRCDRAPAYAEEELSCSASTMPDVPHAAVKGGIDDGPAIGRGRPLPARPARRSRELRGRGVRRARRQPGSAGAPSGLAMCRRIPGLSNSAGRRSASRSQPRPPITMKVRRSLTARISAGAASARSRGAACARSRRRSSQARVRRDP